MKEKKKNSISRLLSYAGGHKKLTILGCTLSGVSAVLSMAPYICIWFVARGVFDALPNFQDAQDLVGYGWQALWFALAGMAVYFAALMCTHLAAFRTARNMSCLLYTSKLLLPYGKLPKLWAILHKRPTA